MPGGGPTPPSGKGGGSSRPRGAVALQVKLTCASLDQVKARYPEIKDRRFILRTMQAWPLDTLVRLEAKLIGGAHCFLANAVVERISPVGEKPASITLALISMDDAGRELVAWMGGKPPRLLPEAPAKQAPPVMTPVAAPPAKAE